MNALVTLVVLFSKNNSAQLFTEMIQSLFKHKHNMYYLFVKINVFIRNKYIWCQRNGCDCGFLK